MLRQSKQQKQTKIFFNQFAKKWQKSAKIDSHLTINVIKQRNDYVVKIARRFLKNKSKTLDVGCGTGDLTISLLQNGFDSYGIDFAPSMIKKARLEALRKKFSSDRFELTSIFDYTTDLKYDLISANGFIEYVSERQFIEFIQMSYEMLKARGLFVFSLRNRLFNVFSYNEYTLAEMKIKQLDYLIEECIMFNKAKNLIDLLKKKRSIRLSRNLKIHGNTGFNIDTRYQYTPLQTIEILRRHGFKTTALSPIHIHIFTTGARSMLSEIHDYVSNYAQEKENAYLPLIPQSSSFMIVARKL